MVKGLVHNSGGTGSNLSELKRNEFGSSQEIVQHSFLFVEKLSNHCPKPSINITLSRFSIPKRAIVFFVFLFSYFLFQCTIGR